jgi:hypothetical protein
VSLSSSDVALALLYCLRGASIQRCVPDFVAIKTLDVSLLFLFLAPFAFSSFHGQRCATIFVALGLLESEFILLCDPMHEVKRLDCFAHDPS